MAPGFARLGGDLRRAVVAWVERDDHVLAASIAFYGALSLFPLLLIVLAVVGWFLGYTELGHDARAELLSFVAHTLSPRASEALAGVLATTTLQASRGGPIGALLTLVTAGGLFTQIDYAVNRIWTGIAPSKPVFHYVKDMLFVRARSFVMLFVASIVVVLAITAALVSSLLRAKFGGTVSVAEVWRFGELGSLFLILSGFFTLLHRYVPRQRPAWGASLKGGILAALLWELSRQAFTALAFDSRFGAYGVVGSFLALLLWIFVGAMTLLLSVEYVREASVARREDVRAPRARRVSARPAAVRS